MEPTRTSPISRRSVLKSGAVAAVAGGAATLLGSPAAAQTAPREAATKDAASWKGTKFRAYVRHDSFHSQPDSFNDLTLIGVLKQLRRFLRGAPATVVWDNLPCHHSHVVGAWLAGQRHWLAMEFLPGYAHDLDPVEGCGPT